MFALRDFQVGVLMPLTNFDTWTSHTQLSNISAVANMSTRVNATHILMPQLQFKFLSVKMYNGCKSE